MGVVCAIREKGTDRSYVGSSTKTDDRWRKHLARLRSGRHSSRLWNELGEEEFLCRFSVCVLEHVEDLNELYEREAYCYWEEPNPVFNTLVPDEDGRFGPDDELRLHLSRVAVARDAARRAARRAGEAALMENLGSVLRESLQQVGFTAAEEQLAFLIDRMLSVVADRR